MLTETEMFIILLAETVTETETTPATNTTYHDLMHSWFSMLHKNKFDMSERNFAFCKLSYLNYSEDIDERSNAILYDTFPFTISGSFLVDLPLLPRTWKS